MERESHNVRRLAWKALLRWNKGGIFAETLVARAAAEHKLVPADRALLQALLYDTLRHLSWLDHLRKTLRPAPLEDDIRALVLLGLCQLFVLQQPEHAAVSETVKLAPPRVRGVVNGMLRNAVRRKEEFMAERDTLPPAIRYSTPSWLVKRWMQQFGEQDTLAMLAWNTQTPPLYARLNPLHPMEVPEAWEALTEAPLWYRVYGALPTAALHAGQVYIADPSTRHSVRLLAPKAGERVLDACAAPGGKSAAILGASEGRVSLLSTDAEAHRLPMLEENLRRAGGQDVHVAQHDWSTPCPAAWCGAFDAVLLDVPCSNSGVLQRRVDARWRLQESEISRLAALQAQILEQGAAAVKPGGRLVYSTCSIDREEDRDVVDTFLAAHPDFRLIEDILVLPHRAQADGAYAALLARRA